MAVVTHTKSTPTERVKRLTKDISISYFASGQAKRLPQQRNQEIEDFARKAFQEFSSSRIAKKAVAA